MHTLVFQFMKNCCPFCGPIPGHHNQKLDPDQDLVARLDDFGPLMGRRHSAATILFLAEVEVEACAPTLEAYAPRTRRLLFLDEVWRREVGGRIPEMARVNATP